VSPADADHAAARSNQIKSEEKAPDIDNTEGKSVETTSSVHYFRGRIFATLLQKVIVAVSSCGFLHANVRVAVR
jgi:hypothetical protein